MADELTQDEQVEQATLEANVVAEEAAEAAEVAPAEREPSSEPLGVGELIRKETAQTIQIGGQAYHRVRVAMDGRFIYAPVRPRD